MAGAERFFVGIDHWFDAGESVSRAQARGQHDNAALSDDAVAENRRTAHALGKYKGVGDLPRFTTDAAETVMRDKSSKPQAMFREDVGEITFDYGDKKSGLEHIRHERIRKDGMTEEQANEFVTKRVPEILAHGRASEIYGPEYGRRMDITYKDSRVTLSLRRKNNQETWVLTGYEDFPLSE